MATQFPACVGSPPRTRQEFPSRRPSTSPLCAPENSPAATHNRRGGVADSCRPAVIHKVVGPGRAADCGRNDNPGSTRTARLRSNHAGKTMEAACGWSGSAPHLPLPNWLRKHRECRTPNDDHLPDTPFQCGQNAGEHTFRAIPGPKILIPHDEVRQARCIRCWIVNERNHVVGEAHEPPRFQLPSQRRTSS